MLCFYPLWYLIEYFDRIIFIENAQFNTNPQFPSLIHCTTKFEIFKLLHHQWSLHRKVDQKFTMDRSNRAFYKFYIFTDNLRDFPRGRIVKVASYRRGLAFTVSKNIFIPSIILNSSALRHNFCDFWKKEERKYDVLHGKRKKDARKYLSRQNFQCTRKRANFNKKDQKRENSKKAKGKRSRHALHAEYTSDVITCGSLRTKWI